MLNLKDIRKDVNFFKKKLEARYIKNSDVILDELLANDEDLRKVLDRQQELQNQRNTISKNLSFEKDKGNATAKP